MSTTTGRRRAGPRDLAFLGSPDLWPLWPFLPLTRPTPGSDEKQLGVLYDARGCSGRFGYSSTVFLTNLYALPGREADLLTLAHLTYDSFDELADDGWIVD
jgi:hypothetical protein